MIPYGKQTIEEDDIAAVVAALKSDFLTCGPEVEAFEQEFATMVGAKHAVAVSNATAALHLAMLVAKVGPGDRVVTSSNTFLASANCAAYVGATPDFSDIDPVSYNLCPRALEKGWKDDTKAVIAVAYGGQSPDMPEIARVTRGRGAIVIEDACHGPGGGFLHEGNLYQIGGHPWADMTIFSFHPVKSMTTGEGGLLVTDNDEYAAQARRLRSHGMERDSSKMVGFGEDAGPAFAEQGPWVYEMLELGHNFRITDLQCALGRSQLKKLPGFIHRRREIVARYNSAFAGVAGLTTPGLSHPENAEHTSWHLYTVQIDFSKLGMSRTDFMMRLREKDVGSQVLYIPVHMQPWYRSTFGYGPGKCPEAESFYAQALSLPLYPSMGEADVAKVIEAVTTLIDG